MLFAARDREVGNTVIVVERDGAGLRYSVHAGERGDSLNQLPLQRLRPRIVITCSSEIEGERGDILHAETGINSLCAVKAAQQKPSRQ